MPSLCCLQMVQSPQPCSSATAPRHTLVPQKRPALSPALLCAQMRMRKGGTTPSFRAPAHPSSALCLSAAAFSAAAAAAAASFAAFSCCACFCLRAAADDFLNCCPAAAFAAASASSSVPPSPAVRWRFAVEPQPASSTEVMARTALVLPVPGGPCEQGGAVQAGDVYRLFGVLKRALLCNHSASPKVLAACVDTQDPPAPCCSGHAGKEALIAPGSGRRCGMGPPRMLLLPAATGCIALTALPSGRQVCWQLTPKWRELSLSHLPPDLAPAPR